MSTERKTWEIQVSRTVKKSFFVDAETYEQATKLILDAHPTEHPDVDGWISDQNKVTGYRHEGMAWHERVTTSEGKNWNKPLPRIKES